MVVLHFNERAVFLVPDTAQPGGNPGGETGRQALYAVLRIRGGNSASGIEDDGTDSSLSIASPRSIL